MSPDVETKEAVKIRAALARRIKKRRAELLKPLGFLDGAHRKTRTLYHSCCYYAPRSSFFRLYYGYAFLGVLALDDEKNPNAPPREIFRFNPDEDDDYGGLECFGFDYCRDRTWDSPTTPDEADALFEEVDAFFRNDVLPFFETYRESDAILRDYDAGIVDRKYFNQGANYSAEKHLGLARFRERRFADALAHFRTALAELETKTSRERACPPLFQIVRLDDLRALVEIVEKTV